MPRKTPPGSAEDFFPDQLTMSSLRAAAGEPPRVRAQDVRQLDARRARVVKRVDAQVRIPAQHRHHGLEDIVRVSGQTQNRAVVLDQPDPSAGA